LEENEAIFPNSGGWLLVLRNDDDRHDLWHASHRRIPFAAGRQ